MNAFRKPIVTFVLIWLVSLLAACATSTPTAAPTAPPPTAIPMLKPGDTVGQMTVTTGPPETDGPPIWAFCPPAFSEGPGVNTVECSVPPLPELPIGHGWWSKDEALRDSNWNAMTWELYLDGQRIDLDAFGSADIDLPQTGLPGYDPNEEVVTKLRTWDVLLKEPALGKHTLRSVVHLSQQVDDGFFVTKAGTYELVVNFTVEAP